MELLYKKFKIRYEGEYAVFVNWFKTNKVGSYSENVLLVYFTGIAKSKKSSTMWSIYSMLRTTFSVKHNVAISKYRKMVAISKKQSVG